MSNMLETISIHEIREVLDRQNRLIDSINDDLDRLREIWLKFEDKPEPREPSEQDQLCNLIIEVANKVKERNNTYD